MKQKKASTKKLADAFYHEKREIIGCFQLLLLFFHGLIISQFTESGTNV
jgi:hypothetical protein